MKAFSVASIVKPSLMNVQRLTQLTDPVWAKITDWRHRADFSLRQRLGKWLGHRPMHTLPLTPLVPLQSLSVILQNNVALNARYNSLLALDYSLLDDLLLYGQQVTLESLVVLDAFYALRLHWPQWDQALPVSDSPTWLDIGSKNGFYLPGLRWQQQQCYRQATPHLKAIELDAYRRYTNGRTRADYAHCIARRLGHCTYTAGDFLHEPYTPVDVITNFYPFMFPHSVAHWGLPRHTLKPHSMAAKAWQLLKPGGVLITTHYGNEEADACKTLLLKVIPEASATVIVGPVALPPTFMPSKYIRWLTAWQKPTV
jgi:hypothetical protein